MSTILVIEDEPAILDIIYDILESEGFLVMGATDGPEGIAIATDQRPDLILCDVGLPSMGGYEILQQLRQQPETLAIPLIFLTAYSSPQDIRRGMELGADDYLTKPFVAESLIRAIHTRLNKHSQLKSHYETALEQLRQSITLALPHEFRTPLVGILGASEFLLADLENLDLETIRELLVDIHSSGDRLHMLIQKYLCFVQLQERYCGRMSLEPTISIAPQELVAEIAEHILTKYQRYDDFVMYVDSQHTHLNGNDCHHLLGELLENAAKFSEPGTVIAVSFFDDETHEHIVVRDHGRGMTEAERHNIGALQQFQRNHHEQQGAGLGLAIAQLVTHIYNGELHIDSELGVGTSVYITLPYPELPV